MEYKGFVPQYMARKYKADITIRMDLTKHHYVLLKDAYSKVKDCANVTGACADIIAHSV